MYSWIKTVGMPAIAAAALTLAVAPVQAQSFEVGPDGVRVEHGHRHEHVIEEHHRPIIEHHHHDVDHDQEVVIERHHGDHHHDDD
jgi:hypothetical protein